MLPTTTPDIESSIENECDEEWLEYFNSRQGDVSEIHSSSPPSSFPYHETESFIAEAEEEEGVKSYLSHLHRIILPLAFSSTLITLIFTCFYSDRITILAERYVFVFTYAFCCLFRSNKML
jgi:hypothetical protein